MATSPNPKQAVGAGEANGPTDSSWYVMLFPSAEETAAIGSVLQELADCVGGVPTPTPHVTVGYFEGAADVASVVAQLRPLAGPIIQLRAAGLFSWSEEPHPLFGWNLSLRVRRDAAVRAWQRAARVVLEPLSLRPTIAWDEQQPHMHVLRDLPVPPRAALQRLSDTSIAVTCTASRLIVAQRVADRFVTWLEQGLCPDNSLPS